MKQMSFIPSFLLLFYFVTIQSFIKYCTCTLQPLKVSDELMGVAVCHMIKMLSNQLSIFLAQFRNITIYYSNIYQLVYLKKKISLKNENWGFEKKIVLNNKDLTLSNCKKCFDYLIFGILGLWKWILI